MCAEQQRLFDIGRHEGPLMKFSVRGRRPLPYVVRNLMKTLS